MVMKTGADGTQLRGPVSKAIQQGCTHCSCSHLVPASLRPLMHRH